MMTKKTSSNDKPQSGCCNSDPYADLPPEERRPKSRSWKTAFRQVTCPGCGVEFWTNSESNLCTDCRKKGKQVPLKESKK